MEELIQINVFPVRNVLKTLLQDKTTGKNIIFATDNYIEYGCTDTDQITVDALLGFASIDLQPRMLKAQSEQSERTRKKAEVFTPTWICNFMNNHCDEVWFGKANVFNKQSGESWKPVERNIPFKKPEEWQAYVLSRRLEITCGEAPFLVTRYDATTGELLPVPMRVGVLDRKLRVVNENVTDEVEWWDWTVKAFESTYGYEFQGDNLLIARINLLVTFCDNVKFRWQRKATEKEIKYIANIIAWNIWQMDGQKDTVPLGMPGEPYHQYSLFGEEDTIDLDADDCKIYNHRSKTSVIFKEIKEGNANMKFDFVIGNPPYQEEVENNGRPAPIYHFFMDAAYQISDHVELITPARFLFNAGQTPKSWNEKMISDNHITVLFYEQNSKSIFRQAEIPGGICITYRDADRVFGDKRNFTQYSTLNDIYEKVRNLNENTIASIIVGAVPYRFSDYVREDFPNQIELFGKSFDLRTNVFNKLNNIIFFESKPADGEDYIQIIGLFHGKRATRYIKRKYVVDSSLILDKYNLLLSESNGGAGQIGKPIPARIIGDSIIASPGIGHLQTFISIGSFENTDEMYSAQKYLKTRFLRVLLGIKKVTQHNPRDTWTCVPLQNFSSQSDIDWSKSISEIDRQLYAKYGLSKEEIAFIETHVKEME